MVGDCIWFPDGENPDITGANVNLHMVRFGFEACAVDAVFHAQEGPARDQRRKIDEKGVRIPNIQIGKD